jgi:hypothetical protein
MVSDAMIHIPRFMNIGSGIQIILMLLPRQSDRLQCWCYWWEGFMTCRWDDISCHRTCILSFITIRILCNIKGSISKIWEAVVLVLLMREVYDIRNWDGLRWHDIYIPSFMRIGMGFQPIIRFCLNNLKGSNVGITDGNDLWSASLRWSQMAWYIPSFMRINWGI